MAAKNLRADAKSLAEAWLDSVNVNNIIQLVINQPSKKLAAGLALEIYISLKDMGKDDDATAFQTAIYNRAITS